MSHIATVKVKLKDLSLLSEVCAELGIPCELKPHSVSLYADAVEAIASFRLKDWRFPVAVLSDGTVQYDNFEGRWGADADLHRVLRRYSERIAVRQAQRMGMSIRREERQDGSILLRLLA